MEDDGVVKEFLIESSENLGRLDREIVELEGQPDNTDLLSSIFRTVHTIKGTCGFLNFATLEKITHHVENILSQLRNGERELTPELVSLILETVDAIRVELASIEATSLESGAQYADLLRRQEAFANPKANEAAPVPESSPEPQLSELLQASDAIQSDSSRCDSSQPAESSPAPDARKGIAAADSTIRVDVALLNKLMNLVGELVLSRNQILQFTARREDAGLNATAQRLNLITTELQEGVMKTRMQPIGIVWKNLPRVVRDLGASCGKQIVLDMQGAETELDKTIIEAIKDPLTHIVRNSCDHGFESAKDRAAARKPLHGRLTLRAFHEGGNVNIEIADDGRGIDPQKIKAVAIKKGTVRAEVAERMSDRELINLVFIAGFSTATQVSSISGRGVGMDVVRTNIEKIGGAVELSSKTGVGTTVKIRIPLTLAIIPGLVITSAEKRFVIPQASLVELIRLEGAEEKARIEKVQGLPVYRRRGNLLPLVRLNDVLRMEAVTATEHEVMNVVVLQAEERQFGLVVDSINDTQEIVVKPLVNQLKSLSCYAGATIMGDGKVSLILDVPGIARLSGIAGDAAQARRFESSEPAALAGDDRQMLLLFRAGEFERLAVPLSMVARLEEIPRARIEHAGGGMVVQYRDQILPLIPLSSQTADPATVIVFANGARHIGILVDNIIDIVEDSFAVRKTSQHKILLGSAVIGNKVTDLLDLQGVIEQSENDWFQQQPDAKDSTVLLADESSFSRALMRSYLEFAGHRVLEAANPKDAMDRLGKESPNAVLASLDLPNSGAFELLEFIKRRPPLSEVPVIALSTSPEQKENAIRHLPSFSGCLPKFDRVAMLSSLEALSRAVQPERVLAEK